MIGFEKGSQCEGNYCNDVDPALWMDSSYILFVCLFCFFAASESVVETGVFHDAFLLPISFRWNTPLGRSARKED